MLHWLTGFYRNADPTPILIMKTCLRILLSAYGYAVFYLGLLAFGMVSLVWSLIAMALHPVLPDAFGRLIGRFVIMSAFRLFLGSLQLSGMFHFDLDALDDLRDEPSLIIAPNHPSLWDALLIVSRLPDVACIMKAQIVNNIFLGGGARLARYIRNEPLRQMVQLAMRELQRGSRLLLFPEGTRTVRQPVNSFKGSIGVIASRARAPVQTVFIETDTPFLTKGWPVYKMPRLPLAYRVRLGRRFDPPADSAAFVAELEQYFLDEMSKAPPPLATAPSLAEPPLTRQAR